MKENVSGCFSQHNVVTTVLFVGRLATAETKSASKYISLSDEFVLRCLLITLVDGTV